jgi:hypothetical protein
MVNASSGLTWTFAGLALAIASVFVFAVHRTGTARQTIIAAIATAGWLGITLALARTGMLGFSTTPPTMMVLIAVALVLATAIGTSGLGRQIATGIPLAALVGVQGFRFPLELMLHRAYNEGLMPIQMSFSGFNFDILTGLSAILVALVLVWKPRSLTLVRIWNTTGIVLLANIVTIALLSAPSPFRAFHNEPANVWIAETPWVWLPTVYVFAAITGHILVYRRIRHELAVRSELSRSDPESMRGQRGLRSQA